MEVDTLNAIKGNAKNGEDVIVGKKRATGIGRGTRTPRRRCYYWKETSKWHWIGVVKRNNLFIINRNRVGEI